MRSIPETEPRRGSQWAGTTIMLSRLTDSSSTRRFDHIATLAFLALGVTFRGVLFLGPHSLWTDEANVGLNLIERNALQLLGRLDHDQYAPVGFLLLAKLSTSLLGYSEQGFRSVGFLSGVVL